jgi:hypothetical protein
MDLALNGIAADALVNGCRFRQRAAETAEWRWRRGRSGGPTLGPAPGWARSCRLATLCGGDCPSDYIEEHWLDEWLELRPEDPLFFSYFDMIEAKLGAMAQGYWDAGFGLVQSDSFQLRFQALKSVTGRLVFAIPDAIGTLYPPIPFIKIVDRRTNDAPPARCRLLDS